jgi:hypothetical protein
MIRKSGNRFSLGTNAKRLPGDHAQTKRSGRERIRMRLFVDRDRLEAIIAGAAEPQERRTARTAFNPIGFRNWLAALCAGISARQIAGIKSSHGASPFRLFCNFLECGRSAAGNRSLISRRHSIALTVSFERQSCASACRSMRFFVTKCVRSGYRSRGAGRDAAGFSPHPRPLMELTEIETHWRDN